MQYLEITYTAHPIITLIYLAGMILFYCMFIYALSDYIKYSGLNYKSGLYANMTAKQQRWEWRKKKAGLWIGGGLIALPVMAIIWPITVVVAILKKIK